MTTLGELEADVASCYLSLNLPRWPDPHAGVRSPRDDEYSRVTEPGRYRIVHARARAWTAVLEDALGVSVETLPAVAGDRAGRNGFHRGVRVVPRRPDALPLLLLERDVQQPGEASLAVLDIAVARPDVVVSSEPDCGCDACDSGSEDLIGAIDAAIGQVIDGPFVVLRGKTWRAWWHRDGSGAGNDGRGPDLGLLVETCRRLAQGEDVALPEDAEAFVSHSWLS